MPIFGLGEHFANVANRYRLENGGPTPMIDESSTKRDSVIWSWWLCALRPDSDDV
jgi:hypothetical protein